MGRVKVGAGTPGRSEVLGGAEWSPGGEVRTPFEGPRGGAEAGEDLYGTVRAVLVAFWATSAVVSKVSVLLLARVDDISTDAEKADSESISESELEEDGELAKTSETEEIERS